MRIVVGAYFRNAPIPAGGTPVSPFYGVIKWARSVARNNYHCVLISDDEKPAVTSELTGVHVTYDPAVSVYHNRFFAINKWLQDHANTLSEIWVTDTPDVEMLNTPTVGDKIYVGYEKHENADVDARVTAGISDVIPDYNYVVNPRSRLLNCGIIGGPAARMLPFMRDYIEILRRASGPFADTPAINYLGYKYGAEFGPHVTTKFGSYERTAAWFRHK